MKTVSTKKTLLASVFAMLLCVSLFVGSTFARFTSTATTSVNTIKAGNLKVELLAADGESPLGDSLKWVAKDGRNQDEIYWEPGCSYNLEGFRIKNGGNLALKYKVVISGLTGSAKLLEVIDFTVKMGGDTVALEGWEGSLTANDVTDVIIITGTMKADAGNDYMNEKIENISITVVATQDTVESDSNGSDYDGGAEYPAVPVKVETEADEAGNIVTKKAVTLKSSKLAAETQAPIAVATVPAATKVEEGVSELKLEIKEASEPDGFTVKDGMKANTYDIKVVGVAADNTVAIPVTLNVGKNLSGVELYHNGVLIPCSYDAETGIISFETATFSPFTVTSYENPTIVSSVSDLKSAIEKGGIVVLGEDLTLNDFTKIEKPVTIDLNGKTITQNGKASFVVNKKEDSDDKVIVTVLNGKFVLNGSQPRAIVLGKGSYYGTDYNSRNAEVTVENVDFDVAGSQGVAISAGTNTGMLTVKGGVYTVSGTQAKGLDIGNCHAKVSGITVNVTGNATGINLSSVLEDTLVEISDSTVEVAGVSPFYDQDCINISGTNVNLTNTKLIVRQAAKSGRNIEMSANNWFDSKLVVKGCEIINESTGSAVYNNFGSPSSFAHMTTAEFYDTTVTAKYAFGAYKHNSTETMFVIHSGVYSSKIPSAYYQVVLAEGSVCTEANGVYTVTAE